MWLIQFLLEWVFAVPDLIATQQAINAVFALVCLAAAFGANARAVALVSAALYVLLVLV